MKKIIIILFMFFVSACATVQQEKQNAVNPTQLAYEAKRNAGYVYGVAYSSLTAVSRILENCKSINIDKIKLIRADWESRNIIDYRAANLMISMAAQDSEEDNIAKKIIESEANPTLEQYLKNNFNGSCEKQINSIVNGLMDIGRDEKVRIMIDNYINNQLKNLETISSKITEEKLYQALAATISIEHGLNSSLEYCKINFPEHSGVYENFRSSWLNENRTQLTATKLVISVAYRSHNDKGNSDLAESLINYIKEHSKNVSEKVVFSLSENKEDCKILFNDHKNSPSLKAIAGYENEISYISESYNTFILNNKIIPETF